jgi:hypothetical protein
MLTKKEGISVHGEKFMESRDTVNLKYGILIKLLLLQLLSNMVGVILFFAGLMFLIENSGDPFHNYQNAREPGSMRLVIGGHHQVR